MIVSDKLMTCFFDSKSPDLNCLMKKRHNINPKRILIELKATQNYPNRLKLGTSKTFYRGSTEPEKLRG